MMDTLLEGALLESMAAFCSGVGYSVNWRLCLPVGLKYHDSACETAAVTQMFLPKVGKWPVVGMHAGKIH